MRFISNFGCKIIFMCFVNLINYNYIKVYLPTFLHL